MHHNTSTWKLSIAALVLLMVPGLAFGQIHQTHHEETAGTQVNFLWAMPQGEFADHIDRYPVGGSFLFGGQIPDVPVFLGTELSFLNYGKQQFLELQEIEHVAVQALRVGTTHNVGMGHLVARLQFPFGFFRPYVEGVGGLKALVSKVHADSDVVIFPRGLDAHARDMDWSLSYGGGAGIQMIFYTLPSAFSDRTMDVSLTIGARYLFGTEADFTRLEDVQEVDGRFVFETTRSRTDMLIPQIGVQVSH